MNSKRDGTGEKILKKAKWDLLLFLRHKKRGGKYILLFKVGEHNRKKSGKSEVDA